MLSAPRKRPRSFSSERCLAPLLSGLALTLFAASCSGGERDQRAERTTASESSNETEARAASTEQGATTQSTRPRPPKPKRRALVWIGLEDAHQVALVDVARGKVLARRAAPGGPHNVTVASDGTAAATLYGSDRLVLIPPHGRPQFVELGGSPHDVKARGGLFVVANEAGRRLDLIRDGSHVASVPLAAEPHDLAIAPGGKRAWVTLNDSDEFAIVDLGAREVARYLSTGFRPHDILFAPDQRLWVTDWQGPVHVFDRRGRLQGNVELGQESHHLAFTPNGWQAWISDHAAERVFVVDARSFEVIAALPVSGGPHHVAITPDGRLAAVADHESGTVVVYDVKRRTRLRVIDVGAGPHGVWAAPAERSP
jgi:DNA-binding beta-propeller fold protein YncE